MEAIELLKEILCVRKYKNERIASELMTEIAPMR